jgi:hypothetical protein
MRSTSCTRWPGRRATKQRSYPKLGVDPLRAAP